MTLNEKKHRRLIQVHPTNSSCEYPICAKMLLVLYTKTFISHGIDTILFILILALIISVDDGTGVIPCCCWKSSFKQDNFTGTSLPVIKRF